MARPALRARTQFCNHIAVLVTSHVMLHCAVVHELALLYAVMVVPAVTLRSLRVILAYTPNVQSGFWVFVSAGYQPHHTG